MPYLEDVHTIAGRFLRDIESGKVSFYATPEVVTLPTAEPLVSKVMVMRDNSRPYLVGVKRDGTPVWSRDVQHARSYDSDCLTLVNALQTVKKAGERVETFPACHFHG